MVKYDGLRGQELLEVEDPDKEGGITLIFKDNRFIGGLSLDGIILAVSGPIEITNPGFVSYWYPDSPELGNTEECKECKKYENNKTD